MYISKKHAALVSAIAVGACLALFVGDASAAPNITTVGAQWKTQLNSILGIGKLIFGVVGFFMFAAGLFYFYKDNKQQGQGHLKTGIIAMLVGTGLMIIPWLLGLFTESVASGEGDKAVSKTQGTDV
ncbi:hypothetical protein V0M98_32215 (plasmid) [Pseudomonas silesiensis]|uniref:hypothetical protein n=1 Tax=Pseudomonas silesiensis TaxID=1853130 RepID=UPI0030D41EF4